MSLRETSRFVWLGAILGVVLVASSQVILQLPVPVTQTPDYPRLHSMQVSLLSSAVPALIPVCHLAMERLFRKFRESGADAAQAI
jgi:hypothetical protein